LSVEEHRVDIRDQDHIMSHTLLKSFSLVLLMGAAQPVLAQGTTTTTPLPPASGTNAGAGGQTSTGMQGATTPSDVTVDSGVQSNTEAGTTGQPIEDGAAATGDAGTDASTSNDTSATTTDTNNNTNTGNTTTDAPAGNTTTDATTGNSTTGTTDGNANANGSATTETNAETSASTDITVEQQTEIRSAVTELNVEPTVDIDFDINVGVAVPSTVVLQPVPARVISIVPAYEGFLFFTLADGRLVIVDPDSLQIVLIIG
jgi:hypothetical protein